MRGTDKADVQEEMIDIIQKINYHFNEIRKYANKRDKLKSEFLKDIISPGKFYKFIGIIKIKFIMD